MTQSDTAQSAWNATLMNTYGTPPVTLVSGKGAHATGEDGTDYIDLLAGIAVNSLGHAHPAIVEAVSNQIGTLGHVSNLFGSTPVVAAAEKLKARFGDESARLFFCNSGGEANEAAFKLARLTGRFRVLAAVHGFHGRTMGSLALTGQPEKRAPFEPLPAGVEFFDYGDLDAVRALVAENPSEVAAIIVEPIQGETGVIPAPEGFLTGLREICDESGALLLIDEVQTGIGRTGDFFAFQHEGIWPDVVTMAKGLGGGLPIGAVLARGKAAELFTPGSHGTTFGGNPVACAAANAVLDTIDDDFLAEVRRKGEKLAEGLAAIDGVREVRGRGLMLGAVLDAPVAKEAVAAGLKRGVIVNAPSASVLRLTPPLVITDEEIDTALERVALALRDAAEQQEGN
ncbi:acetylornithine transaminase [Corynebacterium imitans]|uniref:acetylornithine transaminase n=1 Tax=Corynebacterium imitans TaxID=156978 RepID=UPI001EF28E2B|nr:acetylornithine transaminase [Corynebacterium imitans]MCG7277978.1 acetylornithine transaminase [Corynebacterium imitans]MDK8637627.1 acetylornithine transaminase [Corynebacterium imitans]MDK8772928.1 acetylornithine transaminase [Corynebacterium imitans]